MHLQAMWKELEKAEKVTAFLKCPNESFYDTLVLWALSIDLGLFNSFFLVCPYDLETQWELTVRDGLAQRTYALILGKKI